MLKVSGIENHFQLSYTLRDETDIDRRLATCCIEVKTNKGLASVTPLENPIKLRMGSAVRKHGDDNVDTYSIPGLVSSSKATFLAVYDVRRDSRRDLQGNIDIGISRSADGGSKWEPMIIAIDMDKWGGLPEKYRLLLNEGNGNGYLQGLTVIISKSFTRAARQILYSRDYRLKRYPEGEYTFNSPFEGSDVSTVI